ncbi:hypothetical protein CCHL11_08627 [Colletotrichum chlorophyti]|uniref:Uncharacterized protein n=1 Tax=Colletotrichum chlorophyti TaxID=708187 RepID=A0A1Q8RC31_9PEZI|nr:hypothetical protein CCHL11_08627 [Colletotrichum chlorophyti]
MRFVPAFLARWKSEAADLSLELRKTMYDMLNGANIQHATTATGTGSTSNDFVHGGHAFAPCWSVAFPRILSREDTYLGFKFAKDTNFFINTWGVHMDKEWYDRPEDFRTERYMDKQWGVRPSMVTAVEIEKRRPIS